MSDEKEMIPTRRTLLERLKDANDEGGWRIFTDTYWNLIYQTACKSGLSNQEAEDVVQDTIVAAWKSMPEFQYDPQKGSFKGWLLRLTSWRIVDQVRKREHESPDKRKEAGEPAGTTTVQAVVDPASLELEMVWNDQWQENLNQVALERVKKKVDAKQYQIYDLHVLQDWPVSKVARILNISRAQVYLAKHRIGRLIKKEMERVETRVL
jgi:RNA polymerase sigma-70 factor (ECF subfamily)